MNIYRDRISATSSTDSMDSNSPLKDYPYKTITNQSRSQSPHSFSVETALDGTDPLQKIISKLQIIEKSITTLGIENLKRANEVRNLARCNKMLMTEDDESQENGDEENSLEYQDSNGKLITKEKNPNLLIYTSNQTPNPEGLLSLNA